MGRAAAMQRLSDTSIYSSILQYPLSSHTLLPTVGIPSLHEQQLSYSIAYSCRGNNLSSKHLSISPILR